MKKSSKPPAKSSKQMSKVTLVDAVVAATRVLQAAQIDSAILDARLLMTHALGSGMMEIIMNPERILTAKELTTFENALARRYEREPISHILGGREFWGMPFEVTKDVLDPRPDSETVIEAVLEFKTQPAEELEILDLGTGSGCLLISLLSEYKYAQGTGVDISPKALDVAKRNAYKLTLDGRANFVQSDWCAQVQGTFDVIVSNPPYISETEFADLSAEVTEHEPKLALLAGRDGLDCYRALIPQLPRMMNRAALLVLEIGHTQADAVAALVREAGLIVLEIKNDLEGRPRCVVARGA